MSAQRTTEAASRLLTINLRNRGDRPRSFALFQEPSDFSVAAPVQVVCLFSRALRPAKDGALLTLMVNYQHRAGVQEAAPAGMPVAGSPSPPVASRAVEPAPPAGDAAGAAGSVIRYVEDAGSLDPSRPAAGRDVPPGAFRVVVPATGGSSPVSVGPVLSIGGGAILSNFVTVQPGTEVDCRPARVFHVVCGDFAPGAVLGTAALALPRAVCDFSGPETRADVFHNADGTWGVDMA